MKQYLNVLSSIPSLNFVGVFSINGILIRIHQLYKSKLIDMFALNVPAIIREKKI